jgi:hypothetical protein
MAAALVLTAAASACSPAAEAPGATPGRQVATYRAPSAYRVGEPSIRRLVEELDPDSPQRQILADGHVTATELEQAWVAYAECIREAGFTVSTPVWDPIGNAERIYTYQRRGATRLPSAGDAGLTDDEARRIDDCEANFWFPVSAIYAADTPNHMTPLLARAMEVCMAGRGYDVRGSRSFGEVVGATGGYAEGARVEAGKACLSKAMAELYPDLPYHPDPMTG